MSFYTIEDFSRIISILQSVFLLLGNINIGFYLTKSKLLNSLNYNDNKEFHFIIGVSIFLIFSYPAFLFFKIDSIFLKFYAYLNILIGVIYFLNYLTRLYNKAKLFKSKIAFNRINIQKYIYYFLILLIFLSSLGIFIEIDSIAYHLPIAKYIINNGIYPVGFENDIHMSLGGNQEVLISLGLSICALEYYGLLNATAVFFLSSLFIKKKDENYTTALLAISPIYLISILTASKPFLLSIFFIIFMLKELLYYKKINNIKFIQKKSFASVFSVVIFCASLAKFNFTISSALIIIYYFTCIDKKNFYSNLLVISSSFILIYSPYLLWKFINFEFLNLFSFILFPFPANTIGANEIYEYLKNYKDINLSFPLFLFFPDNFSNLSRIIGLPILIFFFINYKKCDQKFLLIFVIFFLIHILYGQSSTRFFLEHYYWVLILFYFYKQDRIKEKFYYFYSYLCIFTFLPLLIYQVYFFSIPSLFKSSRVELYKKYSDVYNLSNSLKYLKTEKKIGLLLHGRFYFDQDIEPLTNFIIINDNNLLKALKNMKKINIDHVIIPKSNYDHLTQRYKLIVGNLNLKLKRIIQVDVFSRNPFNSKYRSEFYLYEMKTK